MSMAKAKAKMLGGYIWMEYSSSALAEGRGEGDGRGVEYCYFNEEGRCIETSVLVKRMLQVQSRAFISSNAALAVCISVPCMCARTYLLTLH